MLQGIIKEEKLNTFNLPVYYPSSSEVKLEVLTEGSFTINQLEASEVNLSELDDGYNLAQCIRAVAEPLLISHFGRDITKEVFNRFQKIVTDQWRRHIEPRGFNWGSTEPPDLKKIHI
jgi:jasmonate O-methyltransferase